MEITGTMGGTATKERRNVAARSPNEMVARHLLVVGERPSDVAEITGLDHETAKRIQRDIRAVSDGHLSLRDVATVLGTSYRMPYRMIGEELAAAGGDAESMRVTLGAVKAFAERRLRRDAEQRARAMLFLGKSPRLAAIRGRMPEKKAAAILKQMLALDVGPESPGPFTVAQAELATGLRRGQLKNYCRMGRLGEVRKFGTQYVIERGPLEEFIAQDRRKGCKAARWDE